ncbi:type IV secretory system conjugative DNA transfer family protein [Mucilaginibacter boryungensis]|uniref:Type IV secretion system DNA-binding domain-containing protein n=1 Tax=Mucilaginibacter boryungensis TaxID=768480 RepID=A0ABR9XMJ0_9SPHI|nr:type IV secretion system DNA-binding domain-containing protein [Mucilaginibacter boryungensis]MBE9668230.1 type IV secretion system DNA-binding domain-containing protein [Mucilaginibacter boryungensis]
MSARKLTQQFYQWEQRGRGWHLFGEPVQLEPVFEPFFGHYAESEIIDDGVRLSWWHKVLPGQHATTETSIDPSPPVVEAYSCPSDGESVVYTVALSKQYAASPAGAEQLLTMLALSQKPVSFELVATHQRAVLQFACQADNEYWLTTQLRAYLPDCTVIKSGEDALVALLEEPGPASITDFGIAEEFMRPIGTYDGKGYDPYAALFGMIEHLGEAEAVALQVLFCGTCNAWAESILKSVSDSEGGSFFYDAPEMPALAREKSARPLAAAAIRLITCADTEGHAATLMRHATMAVQQSSRSPYNSLSPLGHEEYDFETRMQDIAARRSHRLGMLLNVRELATFAHIPSSWLSRKLLASSRATKRAPGHLRDSSYMLGINEHHGETAAVGIDVEQRCRHMHILGASGTGKSTLLHSLIFQDMQEGMGCCVLDPHGDLIESVLKSVPDERIGDVVLIDPSDAEHPVGFNILSANSDLERELLASDLVALFRRFSTSWGDNLHSVLANAIMAFLYNSKPGHLGDLRKFLIEKAYRETVLSTCTDEELRYYWRVEYPLLKTSSIGSILTRLDSFLRPRVIRNMVCQHRGLDFGALMDGRKIILVKLPQGLMGEENSYLLGACIVAKLQQCAMARQQQTASERVPFFCYIDEFHHFVTQSMASMLTGTRKYAFGLVLANQNMEQLRRFDDAVVSSVLGLGTRICFRLTDTDARRMQEGFSGFVAEDLQNLGVGEAIARVNTADSDFSLTVVPMEYDFCNTESIVSLSRGKYGVPVAPVSYTAPEETVTESRVSEPLPSLPPQQKERDELASSEHEGEATDAARHLTGQRELQEHRYLQNAIKAMAEQHGYRASIEVPTVDGKGLVDVVLEKGGERIAVEVSVTTTAEWEIHNIQKCLREGFSKVVVCSNSLSKLQAIRRKMQESVSAGISTHISIITEDELQSLFTPLPEPQENTSLMKGYRVKITYDDKANDPAKREIIKRIIRGRRA